MRPLWPLYLFITLGLAFLPYPKVEPVAASFDERAGLIDDSDLVLETPKVSGKATWFDATRMGQTSWYTRAGIEYYAAAGPKLREFADWRRWKDHVYILVTNQDTGISLMAELVDFCECSKGQDDERLVDLSPVLFEALGIPLSRGVQRVTIELLD
jgi:hypothetical protein